MNRRLNWLRMQLDGVTQRDDYKKKVTTIRSRWYYLILDAMPCNNHSWLVDDMRWMKLCDKFTQLVMRVASVIIASQYNLYRLAEYIRWKSIKFFKLLHRCWVGNKLSPIATTIINRTDRDGAVNDESNGYGWSRWASNLFIETLAVILLLLLLFCL